MSMIGSLSRFRVRAKKRWGMRVVKQLLPCLFILSSSISLQDLHAAPANDSPAANTAGSAAAEGTGTKTDSAKADGAKADSAKASGAKTTALKEVLDPGKFFGLASFGYAAAKACPEVMSKLFCYCGCDLTDSHVSLLDCFTSIHGVDCHICQEEAILANKMNRENTPIAEIQKAIDEKYSHEYPFENDTPAYKNYKATHYDVKGGTTGGTKPAKSSPELAGPEDPDAPKTPPKLKPGKKMPDCCGVEEHKKDALKKDESKKAGKKKAK